MVRELLSFLSVGVFSSLVLVSENQMNLRSALEVFPTQSRAALVVCVRASGQLGLRWSAPLQVNSRVCEPNASFTPLATPDPLICADIMPEQVGCAGPPETLRIDGSWLPMGVKGKPLVVFMRDQRGVYDAATVLPDRDSAWTFAPP